VRQTNASAAVEQDLLEVALTHDRLTQARARSQRLGGLVWTGIATLLGVLLSVMIVNEIFYWTLRKEIQRKRLDPTNAILMATRAREQSLLTQYQWIKKSDGIVRIPVRRAANLVIAEYAHPALPVAAPSASSTPASSAGSPASASSSASSASSVRTAPPASSAAAAPVPTPGAKAAGEVSP
jgi:hypothetical protein